MTIILDRTLVVGESLIDIVDNADGRSEHVGGSPMNVAVGLARLGATVDLVTAIGADAHGRAVRDHVSTAGVHLINQTNAPSQPTSTATAVIQPDGSARYEFGITWDISTIEAEGYSALHTGSIGAALQPGRNRVLDLFSLSGPLVLRSFDPNIRPGVLGPRDDVLDTVRQIARRCQVVKLSDEDAEWLHPGDDVEQVTARYRDLGAAVVIVTQGSRGFALRCGDHFSNVPATPVEVVDTIGAGDSFMAGLLFALTAPTARTSVLTGRPDPDLLSAATRFAAACAAHD